MPSKSTGEHSVTDERDSFKRSLREKIARVNKILLDGEPGNISVDTHARPPTAGYKPQSVIDAMNEVLLDDWGFEELSSSASIDGKYIISKGKVWVRGVEFEPTAWGQMPIGTSGEGDGRKGGQTDWIKKALSYLGFGSRAYRGEIPVPSRYNRDQDKSESSDRQSSTRTREKQVTKKEEVTNGSRSGEKPSLATKQQEASINFLLRKLGSEEISFDGTLEFDKASEIISNLSKQLKDAKVK